MNHSQQFDKDRYCIRLRGHIDQRWWRSFGDLVVAWHDNGTTTLEGVVRDQAALYGIIAQARDLGLVLISVVPLPMPE